MCAISAKIPIKLGFLTFSREILFLVVTTRFNRSAEAGEKTRRRFILGSIP